MVGPDLMVACPIAMHTGICPLCGKAGALCDSHALPHALFKYILRKCQGKAILTTDDAATPTRYSSDTWETALLCPTCEDTLNHRYDCYGIGVFTGQVGSTRCGPNGITFANIDRQRLRMFLLSVLWRISVSSHASYSNIGLRYNWEHELREALHTGCTASSSHFTVAVYKLRDSTASGGFSNENLRSMIMSPFARDFGDFISVCYMFCGFFVETFVHRAPRPYSKRPGVLFGRSPIFLAPYQEVLDVPEILAVLGRGLHKEGTGLSRIN
jgi:hypothetical protein